MTRPWAVLWDVDGTLVDTAELHFQAWRVLAREIAKPFTRDDFAGTFGWRNPEIIPKLFGSHYSAAEVAALGERKELLYREQASMGVALLPGVRGLLDAVQGHGGQQAIGSSAPLFNIELILKLTGIARHFGGIVSMEDTSQGKPHPDVFLIGAKKLGMEPACCVVIEDAPVGIQAAKAAGMKAVAVTFIGHHSNEKLRTAGADLVVPTLERVGVAQLLKLLG